MACLFCEVAAGRVDAAVVWRTDRFMAFLDHRPLFAGHCLLIPLEHHETLPDLPGADAGPLLNAAALLCRAVEDAMDARGTFVAINNRVSQSVPHLHVHVVPRREKDGLKGFFWPRKKYQNAAEVETVRSTIADSIQRLNSPLEA